MTNDLDVTHDTSDADLQRKWEMMIRKLKAGSLGVTSPRAYAILYQRKIRRLQGKGVATAKAERLAAEDALAEIKKIGAQLAEGVAREHHRHMVPLADVCGEAGDEDEISPSELILLLSDWREGKADPDQVRRALALTRKLLAAGSPLPWSLREFVGDAIAAHLDGDSDTLDRAFGLTRRRGRPPAHEDVGTRIAVHVLRQRLAGDTYEVARDTTAETFECGVTVVDEAWVKYKTDAANALFAERMLFGCGDPSGALLTPAEYNACRRFSDSARRRSDLIAPFPGVTGRSSRYR